ncbi:MAG: hypothetical protein IPL46_10260 [Saprospiraceae bacterium]|nr:hypothetical protein [Saprospiraceae bacterium]
MKVRKGWKKWKDEKLKGWKSLDPCPGPNMSNVERDLFPRLDKKWKDGILEGWKSLDPCPGLI